MRQVMQQDIGAAQKRSASKHSQDRKNPTTTFRNVKGQVSPGCIAALGKWKQGFQQLGKPQQADDPRSTKNFSANRKLLWHSGRKCKQLDRTNSMASSQWKRSTSNQAAETGKSSGKYLTGREDSSSPSTRTATNTSWTTSVASPCSVSWASCTHSVGLRSTSSLHSFLVETQSCGSTCMLIFSSNRVKLHRGCGLDLLLTEHYDFFCVELKPYLRLY